SVRTSIVPPGSRPPPADTPGTSSPITTPQVTTLLRDFAVSLPPLPVRSLADVARPSGRCTARQRLTLQPKSGLAPSPDGERRSQAHPARPWKRKPEGIRPCRSVGGGLEADA